MCLVVIFTLTAINIETGFRMSEGFSFSTELGYWAGFLAFLLILGMPVTPAGPAYGSLGTADEHGAVGR